VALDFDQLRIALVDGEMVDYAEGQLKTRLVQLAQTFRD
jgi:hypothetical protein